jgi:hypothetical protein
LLSFVLGGGRHDVPFPEDRRMEVDMVFELTPDFRLAVEYDGAYWHAGNEWADIRKSHRLVESGFAQKVVRLREEPLELIDYDDVAFAKGSLPAEIVQLTLLHLSHMLWRQMPGELAWNIEAILRSSATRLREEQPVCPECFSAASRLNVLEGTDSADSRRWHRTPRLWRPRRPQSAQSQELSA